jgi:CheY-like chemotaxis protein
VELDAQLRQAQRMELVGQLAGGMAHDFNNLLTIITASTRFASDALPDGSPVHDELAAIDDAARRAAQLTRQLLAFGRKQLPHPELLDLNAVVAGLEPLLRRVIGEDIEVLTRPAAAGGAVVGDQGQLEQVLVNLAVNARDAMPHGGRLLIETADVVLTAADGARHGVDIPPGPYVRLTVCDTGQGMDDATRARAFEPFFTTKEPGKGTGLGLAIVYGIVKQAGGFVWLASTPGRGTRIDVDLPRAAADHPPAPTLGADALAPPGTETLLLVEDADDVRHVARRILTARGYTVIEACDGRAALRAADGHAGPIDLVVTDVVMPEMSGRCLAQQLGVKRPGLRALFMSGYTDDEIVRRGLAAAGAAFLPKPFSADRLAAAVRATLDAPVLRGGET